MSPNVAILAASCVYYGCCEKGVVMRTDANRRDFEARPAMDVTGGLCVHSSYSVPAFYFGFYYFFAGHNGPDG